MRSSSMYMKPIVELDIAKTIDKFNPNKSAVNFIIKKVKTEIIKSLTQIFNLSLSSGVHTGSFAFYIVY